MGLLLYLCSDFASHPDCLFSLQLNYLVWYGVPGGTNANFKRDIKF
jgi:hypothetical protein